LEHQSLVVAKQYPLCMPLVFLYRKEKRTVRPRCRIELE
jgi:hypothetical protein